MPKIINFLLRRTKIKAEKAKAAEADLMTVMHVITK